MNLVIKKVESLIGQYGSVYFLNFDKEKIARSLFAGELNLQNLQMKTESLNSKSLPVKIVEVTLKDINLVIPWMKIFTDAVIIKVNGLTVKVQSKSLDDLMLTKEDEFNTILGEITAYTKSEVLKYLGSSSSIMDFWMIKNLIDRIIDNVQISIRNARIEIEHSVVNPPFQIEVSLKDFELYRTDSSFMTKQFVKDATPVAESGKKQIFKVMNLTNLLVNIKPKDEFKSNSYMLKDDNTALYNVFRFSYQVRLIKNSEHGPEDPDYEASIKFNQNDITLTEWQIQRILNLLDYIKNLNQRFEDLRSNFKYHPSVRISSLPRPTSSMSPEERTAAEQERKRGVILWWQYAILEVTKAVHKNRKKDDRGKFFGLVARMNIDKLFDYDIPPVMVDAYEEDYMDYLETLVKNSYDSEALKKPNDKIHSLESMMFIFPSRVQRVIVRKFAMNFATKEKERHKNSWKNYTLSFIPFMGDPTMSKDEKEIRSMLDSELGKDTKKFSKYIFKLAMELKKGSLTLIGNRQGAVVGKFGFYASNFSIDTKMFEGKIEAAMELKGFQFAFSKTGDGKETLFPIVKSTSIDGGSFMTLKFLSLTQKTKTSNKIEMYLQHLDVMFMNGVIKDLMNFFKIQEYDAEVASTALQGVGKLSEKSRENAKKAISSSTSDISIMVNILSPRVLIPMAKNADSLNDQTNLFVFYLGDMIFLHNIRSGALSNSGSVFNMKLNHCKLEFWEDYENAVRHLRIGDQKKPFELEMPDPQGEIVKNFVIMDMVANIKYSTSPDSKSQNISVLLDNFDLRINPYTFHQLLNIQQLVDFSEVEKKSGQRVMEKRQQINSDAWFGRDIAVKLKEADKYLLKHVVCTKTTLYVFREEADAEYLTYYLLSGFNLFVVQDTKTKGFIVKLWKDSTTLSIAFRGFEEAKQFVNGLLEQMNGLLVKSKSDANKEDQSAANMHLDLVVKRVEVWLFNEIFEKHAAILVKYLELKFAKEQSMKVKVALDSLLVENFERSFCTRGLKNICWIGMTKAPPSKEREILKKGEEAFNKGPTTLSQKSRETSKAFSGVGSVANNPPSERSTVRNAIEMSIHKNHLKLATVPEAEESLQMEPADSADEQDLYRGKPRDQITLADQKMALRSFEHEVEKKRSSKQARPKGEESCIIYLEKTSTLTDIDMHIVNFAASYDIDYIQSLQNKLMEFVARGPPAATPPPAPPKRKKKPKAEQVEDKMSLKVHMRVDRTCLVCRMKNQNQFDVVLVDMKVLFTQMTKRMLVNLYIRRFAVRDLTNYPFTCNPDQLRDYKNQSKQLMFSFVETDKSASPENLDNNAVVVLAEVIGSDFLPENRVGTKAEIILNKGEVNFFMQPTFRLLDFLFYPLLGYLVPDDTKTAPVEELVDRILNIKKLNYNVFLKNTKVNLLPNYDSDRFLVLDAPMIMIMNEVYKDPSRNLSKQTTVPIYAENLSIEIKAPNIRGLKKGVDAVNMKDLSVSMEKLMFGGYLDRILGKETGNRL